MYVSMHIKGSTHAYTRTYIEIYVHINYHCNGNSNGDGIKCLEDNVKALILMHVKL